MSDLTTVVSKAAIPIVLLPLIAFVLSVATLVVMLNASSVVLLANGLSPGPLWAEFRFVQETVIMLYGLAVHALWLAPIYGWLLLVSAWARRTPFLWAAIPLLALSALEKLAFNTSHFVSLLKYRVVGAMSEAFVSMPGHRSDEVLDQLAQLEPVGFLTSPGLWLGLAFAVACLAAAVRLRRYREPI